MMKVVRFVIRRISAYVDYIHNHGFRGFVAEILRRVTFADFIARLLLVRAIPPHKVHQRLRRVRNFKASSVKVSVVIPVLNGIRDGLPRLLKSLRDQTHQNLEIIAVDSGSTDNSIEVLKSFGAHVLQIPKDKFRHDYARNLGAQQATGDYLLFTVCDACFEDPAWIEIGIKHLLRFRAVSYSTPQRYDETAEPYARYLAYTFVSANKYAIGANVFGNRLFGRLGWWLARPRSRERVIHVDDTNHLVDRHFFARKQYSRLTCEDMEFGAKLIRANQKFVFSTMSYVRHFHSYLNHAKYFDRVYVDLMVIQDLVGRPSGRRRPGIVDTTVLTGTLVLGHLMETLDRYAKLGASVVALFAGRPDLLVASLDRDKDVLRAHRVFADMDQRLRAVDSGAFILDLTGRHPQALDLMSRQLRLQVDDNGALRDARRFVDFRDRFILHLRVSVEVLCTRLGYDELRFEDFRSFTILCFINFLASELARLMYMFRDESSKNLEVLTSLRWR